MGAEKAGQAMGFVKAAGAARAEAAKAVELVCVENPAVRTRARVLSSWRERLRGLLGSGAHVLPVLLAPCSSVHSFGMAYPIDLAFIDRRGAVLKVCRALPARRLASCHAAFCTLERPARDGPWLCAGQHVRLGPQAHGLCEGV